MKSFLSLALLLASTTAFAEAGVDSILPDVTAKFLAAANDANSATGKILRKVNDDNTDGRNQNGVYQFPMNAKSIRVVPLTGEDVFGSYCHENSDGSLDCDASEVTENYLVIVPFQFGVHKAGEYGATTFKITGTHSVHTVTDVNGKETKHEETTTVADPTQVNLE